MYRCEWCGTEFEKPKWRMTEDRHIQVCPHCGEPEIYDISDEFEECVCCGKMSRDTDEFHVCDKCSDALYDIWVEAVTKAMEVTKEDYTSTGLFLKKYIKDFEERER